MRLFLPDFNTTRRGLADEPMTVKNKDRTRIGGERERESPSNPATRESYALEKRRDILTKCATFSPHKKKKKKNTHTRKCELCISEESINMIVANCFRNTAVVVQVSFILNVFCKDRKIRK